MDNNKLTNEEKVLLEKISSTRVKLETYIAKVENLQSQVEGLFPKDIKDYRNKYLLEENLKTVTSFYALLLNLNQEVSKTIFSQLDYNRKTKKGDDVPDVDIHQLAERIDKVLNKAKNTIAEKIIPSVSDGKEIKENEKKES